MADQPHTASQGPPHEPEGAPGFTISPEPPASIHILIADADRGFAESCAQLLTREGHPAVTASTFEEALRHTDTRVPDLVLLNLHLEGADAEHRVLQRYRQATPDALVVALTSHPSPEVCLRALRSGAWDCVPKPFSGIQLRVLVGRASHTIGLTRRQKEQQEDLRIPGGSPSPKRGTKPVDPPVGTPHPLRIGTSPKMRTVVELLERVAPTDAPIFITGDYGSGKELTAKWIHRMSSRSLGPFVTVDGTAIPESRLESELFGQVSPPASRLRKEDCGRLESANGGTLFFRNLREIPTGTQAKLLRAIQDGVIQRVGSPETTVVNVRFIAAMGESPQEEILKGTLRKDLYDRLRVVPIHLPPLRERLEDVPLWAQYFLEESWRRHRSAGLSGLPRLTESALQALQSRPWPGNLRELQAVMEHMGVLLEPNARVTADRIPDGGGSGGGDRGGAHSGADIPSDWLEAPYHAARERLIADFELTYLQALLRRAGGNTSRAARMAGVDRTTLYRLMQKHGITRAEVLHEEEGDDLVLSSNGRGGG